jgi:hypothetical protein
MGTAQEAHAQVFRSAGRCESLPLPLRPDHMLMRTSFFFARHVQINCRSVPLSPPFRRERGLHRKPPPRFAGVREGACPLPLPLRPDHTLTTSLLFLPTTCKSAHPARKDDGHGHGGQRHAARRQQPRNAAQRRPPLNAARRRHHSRPLTLCNAANTTPCNAADTTPHR